MVHTAVYKTTKKDVVNPWGRNVAHATEVPFHIKNLMWYYWLKSSILLLLMLGKSTKTIHLYTASGFIPNTFFIQLDKKLLSLTT